MYLIVFVEFWKVKFASMDSERWWVQDHFLSLVWIVHKSRKLAVASWSYSCFSKGRGRSESNRVIFHSNPPKLPGHFEAVLEADGHGLKSCQVSRQSIFSISTSHQNPIMFHHVSRFIWTLAFVHLPLGLKFRCADIKFKGAKLGPNSACFRTAQDTMSTAPSDLEQRLVPVLREHDRHKGSEGWHQRMSDGLPCHHARPIETSWDILKGFSIT